MPISKEAFEKGLSPLEQSIVDFLDKHSQNAYTLQELAEKVNIDISSPLRAITFSLNLGSLKNKVLIRSKIVGSGTYYASAKTAS